MIRANITKFYYLIVWMTLLIGGVVYLSGNINLLTDLSQFIPEQREAEPEHANLNYLLDEIQKGDAATLLMMQISSSSPEDSAKLSRSFRTSLQNLGIFSSVRNGEFSTIPPELTKLFKHRYLLRTAQFDQTNIQIELKKRLRELQYGMGMILKNTLSQDPQNLFIDYIQRFQKRGSPNLHLGVWFNERKENSLLIARMNSSEIDMEQQQVNLNEVWQSWNRLPGTDKAELRLSGPATFALATKNEIQATTNRLALIAGAFMIFVFWIGYRSLRLFIFAALPLASAIIGGLSITNYIFGNIHGITMAFGITILGVCLDYPVHLFSHLVRHQSATDTLKSIWPTLRVGVVTTVIGYLAMLNTGFTGLSQLAVFASFGLVIALLVTRWVVPFLLPDKNRITPVLGWIPVHSKSHCSSLCRVILVLAMITITLFVFQYSHKSTAWEKDIAAISPIPKAAREFDQQLRNSLGVPDVSHLFIIRGKDPELILQKTEWLSEQLSDLKVKGIASSIYSVTDQLPSQKQQKSNQSRLPDPAALRLTLHDALRATPFKKNTFDLFLSDIEESRSLKPLSITQMKTNEVTSALTQDMFKSGEHWVSIIRIAGINNQAALDNWLLDKPELAKYYMNIRTTSSSLVNEYRQVALQRLALGSVMMLLSLVVFLRSVKKALTIFIPVLLALLFSITFQVMMGVSLTLFHILALLLVAGIGLDYSLFFQRPWESAEEQKKQFHGVMMSAASTVVAFAMLGISGVPVMAAMGLTVTLGIIASFVFSWLWITPGHKTG